MYRIVNNKKEIVNVSNKVLALFGGSFDPFHATHLAIAQYVCTYCNVDYTVLVPTKQNPFKDNRSVTESETRLAIIHAAINNCQHILIDDFELFSDESISYTYVTLTHIKNTYAPVMPLHLVIGSDTLLSLDKWKNIQKILEWTTLLVIPRKRYETVVLKSIRKNAGTIQILKDFPISDISSSAIRSALHKTNAENVPDIKKSLSAAVYRYIQEHNLY